ncbi:hypothetical protein PENTCL1PPCAC_16885, partial [Pristionchus entomophagus]
IASVSPYFSMFDRLLMKEAWVHCGSSGARTSSLSAIPFSESSLLAKDIVLSSSSSITVGTVEWTAKRTRYTASSRR